MKSILLMAVLFCVAASLKAQQLQLDPNSVLLDLKKSNPQTKKLLQDYDRFHNSLLNPGAMLNNEQYITSNEKGKIYKLKDGMLCLQPKTNVAINNQMPGTSAQPKAIIIPVNPIPNPLAPEVVSPSTPERK